MERFEISDFVKIESFEIVVSLNDFEKMVVFAVDATELEMFEGRRDVFEEFERDGAGLDTSRNGHDVGVAGGERLSYTDGPLEPALIYELFEVSRLAKN
jgi:hypothetical protein